MEVRFQVITAVLLNIEVFGTLGRVDW